MICEKGLAKSRGLLKNARSAVTRRNLSETITCRKKNRNVEEIHEICGYCVCGGFPLHIHDWLCRRRRHGTRRRATLSAIRRVGYPRRRRHRRHRRRISPLHYSKQSSPSRGSFFCVLIVLRFKSGVHPPHCNSITLILMCPRKNPPAFAEGFEWCSGRSQFIDENG
jgi:hypothetical protein